MPLVGVVPIRYQGEGVIGITVLCASQREQQSGRQDQPPGEV